MFYKIVKPGSFTAAVPVAVALLLAPTAAAAEDAQKPAPKATVKTRQAKFDRCKEACRMRQRCQSPSAKEELIASICSDPEQVEELARKCESCTSPE